MPTDYRDLDEAFREQEPCADDIIPVINTTDKQDDEIVTEAWTALHRYVERERRLFRGVGGLVVLRQQLDQWTIDEVSTQRMALLLGRSARWVKWAGRTTTAVTVPAWLPARVIADDIPTQIPPLRTVVRVPYLGKEGLVILEPGYHYVEETWYEPHPDVQHVELPETIRDEDVGWARDLICNQLLRDFPFATPGDKANAIALFLTLFCRERFDEPVPLFLVEAPTERTGKGLLVQAFLEIAGQADTHFSEGMDNAELTRKLTATLMAGRTVIKFDNITGLSLEVLASAITAKHWSDRIIRSSSLVDCPVRAVFVATGNNPGLSPEIAKRICRIRLVSDEEDPGLRANFLWDPLLKEVKARRGALVRAALTMLKRWVQVGQPVDASQRFSVFTPWAQELGGILKASGVEAFEANRVGAEDLAMELDDWGIFVVRWADLQKLTTSGQVSLDALLTIVRENCLFPTVLAAKNEPLQKRALGVILKQHRERVTAGWRVERKRSKLGSTYCLVKARNG